MWSFNSTAFQLSLYRIYLQFFSNLFRVINFEKKFKITCVFNLPLILNQNFIIISLGGNEKFFNNFINRTDMRYWSSFLIIKSFSIKSRTPMTSLIKFEALKSAVKFICIRSITGSVKFNWNWLKNCFKNLISASFYKMQYFHLTKIKLNYEKKKQSDRWCS